MCLLRASVVLDLFVITRGEGRQVLSSNLGVYASAGRSRRVETGRGSGAASSCGGECAHGCNGMAGDGTGVTAAAAAACCGGCRPVGRVADVRTRRRSDARQQRSVMSDAGAL